MSRLEQGEKNIQNKNEKKKKRKWADRGGFVVRKFERSRGRGDRCQEELGPLCLGG